MRRISAGLCAVLAAGVAGARAAAEWTAQARANDELPGRVSPWHGALSLSDRYVVFWNRVAETVCAAHPDTFVGVYVYSRYVDPPVRETRLHPGVRPVIVNNYLVSPARFRDLIEGWGALTDVAPALYKTPLTGCYGMNTLSYPWHSLGSFADGMRFSGRCRRSPASSIRGPWSTSGSPAATT